MRTHKNFISFVFKSLTIVSLIGTSIMSAACIAHQPSNINAYSQKTTQYSPDSAEVLRRGNSVEHIAGSQADSETVSLAALAPPADDSHKWFITLIEQHGCKPCAKLLADFSTDANLRAFADTTDAKNSWAHFNTYLIDDETQS